MSSFFADPAVGGDGSTTTDDNDANTGLGNWGFQTRLVPMFTNIVAIANTVKGLVTTANGIVNTIIGSAALQATSITTQTPSVSSMAFTLQQTGKLFSIGQPVVVFASTNNWFAGQITAFNSGTGAITVNATSIGTTPVSASSWTVSLTAFSGVATTRTITGAGLATGGGDLSANRTITVTASSTAQAAALTDSTTALTPASLGAAGVPGVLTDAATVAWDMGAKPNAKLTPGGNRIIGIPTNAIAGQTYTLQHIQDATGSRVPDFATNATVFTWGAKGAPISTSWSTAAGKIDIVTLFCLTGGGSPVFRCFLDKDS
jgi:hypothetical protein